MPRGAKKPGNQHNTRHENGVVAPGKRITKQKSNGHLNGSADETSRSANPPTPSAPTARTASRLPDKRTSESSSSTKPAVQEEENVGSRSRQNSSEALEVPPNGVSRVDGLLEQTHRKIDVNVARNPLVHDNSVLHLALTILRSCPLGDTISILIFLLSLPPTLLTVTNALFAVLTFITPTGSSTFPTTFNEIFQGSGGTPSLATIFLTDIIGLILWLVVWTPVQTLSIELAQAVVATTLGGGNATKKKGSDRTLLCMCIVTVSHVARHQWIPKRLFGYDWSAILSTIPLVSKSPPLFSGNDFIPTRTPAGWFRILIALHILIQGLVHVARRWYQKREYSYAVSVSKKSDPEATAGSSMRPPIAVTPVEAKSQIAAVPPEPPPKVPSTIPKDVRDKISSGKKKRKQGTYVRTQQPLWAAFAHTKVTVLREYEQSHSQSEVTNSKAMDTKSLGSASFIRDAGCVWISQVFPTSFCFETSYFPLPRAMENGKERPQNNASTGIDCSKPLYVRINDTDWSSTKIENKNTTDGSADGRWSGEVFGLSPSSSYKCSFVQSEDGVVLHFAIVTTPPSLPTENESSVTSSSPHRPHRPSSPTTPTTTLRNSISASETSLNESQTRQKRSKKDSKAATTALKKDIDVFNSKISKLGSEDKAHFNRHLQWNQHTRQADDAVNSISGEIELLGCVPEEELEASRKKKASWENTRDYQTNVREDLIRNKDSSCREKLAIQGESTTTQQKRERLLARKTKLNDQHERLQSATSQGMDEKERQNSEQAARDLERFQYEQLIHDRIVGCQRGSQENQYHIAASWQQAQIVESAFHESRAMDNAIEERPITPEGDLPGTIPHSTNNQAFRLSAFGSSDLPSGLRSQSGSQRHSDNRPRSTSMLSGNSVYAEFEDQDPAPPMPTRAVETIRHRGRKRSGGSGSGSSGSHPTSPLTGSIARISPVGKRSPVWNQ